MSIIKNEIRNCAKDKWNYVPLSEPIPITKQVWPKGTIPLVCIRTMTFMHENYVDDCISGILMQKTTFPVRVCIHDDASKDKTAELVRKYQAKYPNLIWAYFQNENSYRHPNRKAMRSKFWEFFKVGKYFALCEGDDYWTDPLKLQKQVEFLEENKDIAGVGCYYHIINQFGNDAVFQKLDNEPRFIRFKWDDYLKGGAPGIRTLTMVYRSDAVNRVNEKISFSPKLRSAGDVLLVSSILKSEGDLCLLPFFGAIYRKHDKGLSAGLKIKSKKRKQHFYNYEGIMRLVLSSKKEKIFFWYRNFKNTIKGDIAYFRIGQVIKDALLIFEK
ncbi:glycosyltransferase [Pleomorphovibrio marinus]|uniref:glycosyltransferase n=1 Tax=Pleomorphovibrio marinus TaxID=2164132 RepID=UPI000E0BFE0B|nr:glycosyltransferase [Pleomorphovibrio marinus]